MRAESPAIRTVMTAMLLCFLHVASWFSPYLERLRADFPLVIELINDIWLPQADAKFRDVNTLRRII